MIFKIMKSTVCKKICLSGSQDIHNNKCGAKFECI